MQLRFVSFFLLIFSGFSISIGLPHEICMNTMKGVGAKMETEIWPSFDKLVCSKGKSPGADDWPFLEKQVLIPLWDKLQKKGLKLPNYKAKIKPLADAIVAECAAKQKTNFCKKPELEKMKSCAVDKAMGFIMANMDIADKYGNEANCKIAKKCLEDESLWKWGRSMVVKFAKKVT
ncbi:uncharacterized protein N7518_009091 [Penicillium psychrosexuale]|uniref:uncharacterized protein n=1 Tax=Penicillium psychrosexuale TaxID=1002107 RepID=UPI002545922F|nr:uncharacterized protein N7518_009091 [Penicillium psychrosexuale]KAJ5783414.1 hypothetical protein N7518_009091 [Penicillium psychrosexuale]